MPYEAPDSAIGPGLSATAARDISYAFGAASTTGRAVVRLLESMTGRGRLLRRAGGYDAELREGADFWDVVCRRYGLDLDVTRGSLLSIPATGPVVVVSNHPYGLLDGVAMGRILSQRRPEADYRILANAVFARAPDLDRVVLPIDFDGTRAATLTNMASRKAALEVLGRGGAIGIFPGGTVSTAKRPLGPAFDPAWRTFTAKMVLRSDAVVVPIHFEGANSRLFQIASHIHYILRLGLLIREFGARVDSSVRLAVGAPIDRAALAAALGPDAGDPKSVMDFLRRATYELSPTPIRGPAIGFEFDHRWRDRTGPGSDRRRQR